MASPSDTDLKPYNLATLSSSSRHHLETACPALFQNAAAVNDPSHLEHQNAGIQKKIEVEARPDHEDLHTNTEIQHSTEFTLFPKLPTEIQNEIWKQFSLFQPRTVCLVSKEGCATLPNDGNAVPTLHQINQDTRRDTLKLYGYVALEHPLVANHTVLFNPELDLLYITHTTPLILSPSSITKNLEACGSLSRIRSVALDSSIFYLSDYFREFRKCIRLELVFIPTNVQYAPYHNKYGKLSGFCSEGYAFSIPWLNVEVDEYYKEMQALLARGEEGITPLVTYVVHKAALEKTNR